jgi:hypothetical protein
MSRNGLLSTITSTFRRDNQRSQHTGDLEDDTVQDRPVRAKDTMQSSRTDYGTIPNQHSSPAVTRQEERVDEESRLDGNDVDVWSSVPGRGLDGRGSIRSVRTGSDQGSIYPIGRRRHPLTKGLSARALIGQELSLMISGHCFS